MPSSNLVNILSARTDRLQKNIEAGLLAAIDHSVIATDLDGNIIYWNHGAERLFGWSAKEVFGRNVIDVKSTADSRAIAVDILAKLQIGESWSGEFTARTKDGRWINVSVTDSPVHDENGNLVAIVGVSFESTHRDQPEGHHESRLGRVGHFLDGVLEALAGATLSLNRGNRLRRFGLAVLLYLIAVAARSLLDTVLDQRLPFITFFPILVLSVLLSGFWPTVALLVVSAVTGAWWWTPSPGDELLVRVVAAITFISVGMIVIAPLGYAKHLHALLSERENQLGVINRELKHRIKNLFAVTGAIVNQTIKSETSRQELGAVVSGRIQAVAAAQDLLSITAADGADLRSLVNAVVAPLSPGPARLRTEGPTVYLPKDATTPFGLILHELATNAVKYGAWHPESGGTILIEWRLPTVTTLEFHWQEQNVQVVPGHSREGVGSVLISRALNQATVSHQITSGGVDCRIELPL